MFICTMLVGDNVVYVVISIGGLVVFLLEY